MCDCQPLREKASYIGWRKLRTFFVLLLHEMSDLWKITHLVGKIHDVSIANCSVKIADLSDLIVARILFRHAVILRSVLRC